MTVEQKLQKAAKQIVKEIDQHFKKDGWDLTYDAYPHDLFYRVFKMGLDGFIVDAMQKYNGFGMTFKDGNVVLVKRRRGNKLNVVMKKNKKAKRGK